MKKIVEYKLYRDECKHPSLRIVKEFEYDIDKFDESFDIARMMVDLYSMHELFIEYSYVIGFNFNNEVLGIVELSHQTENKTQTPIKEMFISLMLMGAYSFVMVHNHPNNSLCASDADICVSGKAQLGAELLDVVFRDQIIICDEDFVSMKKQGLM